MQNCILYTPLDAPVTILELDLVEIDLISGGVDWHEVGEGLIAFGATALAIAAAPETAGASLLLIGAVAGGAGSGVLVGDGLSK